MIALLHLSDIHLRTATNPVADRIDALTNALRSEALPLDACFIVIGGDIAFSGLASEYVVATQLLIALKNRIHADYPQASIEYLLVPGNHDCDFSEPTEMRDLALANLPRKNSLDFGGEIVNSCLSVQAPFFAFLAQLTGTSRADARRLYDERRFNIHGHTIEFHLYNTAWLSRREETPGTLFYPVSLASNSHSPDPADVSIALLHHPLNWLEPTNARNLGAYLARTCDVVLTGHEHVPSQSRRSTDTGSEVSYVEGAVLQASDDVATSGFHVIWLDIPARRQMTLTYSWSGTHYTARQKAAWVKLARNPLLAQDALENNEQWSDWLDDPGTKFTHPRRAKLRLSDLYIYPDLTRRSVDPVVKKNDRRVDGRDLAEFIASTRTVVLTGPSDSGKTSLAKRLYVDLRQRCGSVPILILGRQLHKLKKDAFLKLFVQAFGEQYVPSQADRYKQLDFARRAIIIDDFEQARLTPKARIAFIAAARRFAGTVLIFADDLFMIHRLSHRAEDRNDGLGDFEHCVIREFGYRLRGALIERWHGLGYEMVEPPPDIEHRIAATEKFVDTVLGKNLLPAVPLMVLMILQTAEAATNPGAGLGAYGYLYEMLITRALHKASTSVADVDTKYAYLAHLAYAVYRSDAMAGTFEGECGESQRRVLPEGTESSSPWMRCWRNWKGSTSCTAWTGGIPLSISTFTAISSRGTFGIVRQTCREHGRRSGSW